MKLSSIHHCRPSQFPTLRASLVLIFLLTVIGLIPALAVGDSDRPNILLIVADDLGFSDLGCFGSEIDTPHLNRLAEGGLRLTQFYTTGRCCPSRASILTGFYPHRVGLGHMTKDIGRPGYRGRVADDVQTIAQRLGAAGYRSFLSGKWHLGTDDPTKHGFEEFYGTLVSAKTFWDADHFLYLPKTGDREQRRGGDSDSPLSPSPTLPFYGTDALGDHALHFLTQARQTPDRPWFLYLAFHAPHFPLHARGEEIARYADRYHAGWDALREERLERLKQLGIVPEYTTLSPRSTYYDWGDSAGEEIPPWDSLPEDRRTDLARRMAIYAAMVDRMDQNIGRVLADLEAHHELNNTLILFTSDNGACAEWDPFGFDIKSSPHNILHRGQQIDEMGSPGTFHSVGSGWANASNTPWRLYKHFNHEGGIAVPCIVHWPAGMTRPLGQIDETGTHLIDIVPTLLDSTETADNALPGRSLLPLLREESFPDRMLYFEHEGNRAVRDGRWKLVALRDQPWELYDLMTDRVENFNVAGDHPAIVDRLSTAWDRWAAENHVTPLPDDYGVEYLPVTSTTEPGSGDQSQISLDEIFDARGFSLGNVTLPRQSDRFPIEKLKQISFESIAAFDWFPEGPSYRPSDDSYFFTGNQALTRVDSQGQLHEVLRQPGGGGTHFLPDGSALIVGHVGLRRLYPDGRVELLADGKQIGAGNDLSVGIHQEIYFSVPKEGIFRLTPGTNGRLVQVSQQGCNGLDVDPNGKFLYVVRSNVQRYSIDINSDTLGKPQDVFTFAKGQGGGDGCTFDAWGNFYTMHFRTGTIRVIDPHQKTLLAQIPVGVIPATNLTFGGLDNAELFVTAGTPNNQNCQVLKAGLGITGFCGHIGATDYPVLKEQSERGNAKAFGGHQLE